jgi:FlaA1/EpsC-like NDP-sugar epimerase
MNPYLKFGLMILASTLAMFVMMYSNVYQAEHIFFSETRAYMAIFMGAVMAIIMLSFMQGMYHNKTYNLMIYAASVVIATLSLWLVRSQATVDQISWMKAMIPHHSIAILTSERASIQDPRVRELADGIIQTQKEEIIRMKQLINELEQDKNQ